MEFNAVEAAGLLMFLIGLYGLMARRNILKSILCLGVMDIGVKMCIRDRYGTSVPMDAECW